MAVEPPPTRPTSSLDDLMPKSEDFASARVLLFQSVIRELLNKLVGDVSPLDRYRLHTALAKDAYEGLKPGQAISVWPRASLPFLIVAAGAFVGRNWDLVSKSYADVTKPTIAVSQQTFDLIAIIFAAVAVLLVLGLFWAGFLAKRKSQAAAQVVQHLTTFLAGALLGLKG